MAPDNQRRSSGRCLLRTGIGFGCLLVAAVLSAQEPLPKAAAATLDKALKALQEGALVRAEGLYAKAAKQIGRPSFEVEHGLSRLYLQRGEQAESLDAAQRALDSSVGPVQQAVSLNQIGIAEWQLALAGASDKPRGSGPWFEGGNEHLEQSEAAFRKSIELSGGRYASPLFNLAEVFYVQGHFAEAKGWIDQYTAVAPAAGITQRVGRLKSCIGLLVEGNLGDPLFTVGDEGIVRPRKISGKAPRYTEAARQKRIEGTVLLQSLITKQGEVVCIRPLVGLAHGLTQAAIDAVSTWTFEPATHQGNPVPVHYNLTVNFRLSR